MKSLLETWGAFHPSPELRAILWACGAWVVLVLGAAFLADRWRNWRGRGRS